MAATNLLDLMSEKDRNLALERFKRRMSKSRTVDNRISSEIYIISEFGYYYGYAGVEAIRENKITLDEAFCLLEGARKVWYKKLVEQTSAQQVSTGSVMSKSPSTTFKRGIKPFVKRSEI